VGYEIYEKVVTRSSSPQISISKLGRLSFNSGAAKVLEKNAVEHVLLLWDKDARRMAVRSITRKDARAYVVRFGMKNKLAGFAAKTFLVHINYDFSTTGSYPCTWNEKESMFEIDLPAERFGKQEPKRFPRLERGSGKLAQTSGHMKASATA
jgi:hypothetical protein